MRYLISGLLAIALLCSVSTSADAGEFKDGWNTWEEAKEGDMAQYAIGATMSKKYEVEAVKAGKITYKQTILGKDGKAMAPPTSLERTPKKIKVLAKIPSGNGIVGEWTKETYKEGGIELECEVFKYSQKNGELNGEVWFSKEVPCGGVVQSITGGTRSVWLTAFKTETKSMAAGDDVKKEVVSELPKFFAKKGNYIIIKITKPGEEPVYQKREIIKVANTSSTMNSIDDVNKDGTEKATSTTREVEQTKDAYDKMYDKPEKEDVTLKVEAGEFKCSLFTKEYTKMKITAWIVDGIPIKQVIARGDKETVLEVVKIHWAE